MPRPVVNIDQQDDNINYPIQKLIHHVLEDEQRAEHNPDLLKCCFHHVGREEEINNMSTPVNVKVETEEFRK